MLIQMHTLPCYLQVQFAKKVFPKKIEIYETFNSGAVKKIQMLQPDCKWNTVWKTNSTQHIKKARKI